VIRERWLEDGGADGRREAPGNLPSPGVAVTPSSRPAVSRPRRWERPRKTVRTLTFRGPPATRMTDILPRINPRGSTGTVVGFVKVDGATYIRPSQTTTGRFQ